MKKPILITIGITILFLGLCITTSLANDNVKKSSIPIYSGNTFYVGGSGPDNYTRIQDAIYDASEGDTVFVYNDSSPYYENIRVGKSLNIIGEDKQTTVIDGRNNLNVVTIMGDDIKISGFTIQNSGGASWNAGIFIDFMDSNTISDNIIHNNSQGIYLKALANSNIIYSNTITNNVRGIVILGGNFNIIKRNNIMKNEKGIHINYFQTELTHRALLNFILKNNFLLNNEDVSLNYYDSKTSYFNFWWNNYWNEPRLTPKLIVSEVGFMIDWHPALFPNKI